MAVDQYGLLYSLPFFYYCLTQIIELLGLDTPPEVVKSIVYVGKIVPYEKFSIQTVFNNFIPVVPAVVREHLIMLP